MCESIGTFKITLKEFFFFRHNRDCCTLWLAPEPKDALVRLQRILQGVVPDCDDAGKYEGGGYTSPERRPGSGGEAAALKLLNLFQTSWKTMSFPLNEVSFIWSDNPPNDVFRVVCTVRLGHLNL
ncbi:MAG: hypothetical protein UZ01_00693 [Candidatus Brocadia sinica]|nr:MAG: hypothetical protein UZ01_00693 [Candidatus Brocadia sinica]